MDRRLRHIVVLVIALASPGCAAPVKGLYPAPAIGPAKTVYVVSHGWHTGLVVERDAVPVNLWPEKDDFPAAQFLEVGWGDEGFYRARKITAGITLRAIFLPTPGVLHVVGFRGPVDEYFPASEVLPVELSEEGFRELCRFIDGTYERDDAGEAIRLGPGIYGKSAFYRSKGKYYFPKTCNVWTARAIRKAGVPIRPAGSITAGGVIRQARRITTAAR
jgi:uncharacterized protein (TIGR02117 family)